MLPNILSPEWNAKWPENRIVPVIIILLSVALLLPVLYAGVYNHPCPADDFSNADWDDFFGVQATSYLHWSGRYFNNLILSVCPLHWHSFGGYRIAVLLLMMAFMLAFAALVKKALSAYTNAPGIVCTAIASAAILLMVNNMASLSEGFFWYAGAVTYTLPAALFACLLYTMIDLDAGINKPVPKRRYIWPVLLVMAVVGGNETIMVLCDAVCVCLLVYYRQRKSVDLYKLYRLLCWICLICSAIAILAPGNVARQAVTPRNIWMVFPTWIYFTQKLALKWICDPFLLLYSVCLLAIFSPYRLSRQVTNVFAAFLLPVALLFVLSFPGHYALGTVPPARIINVMFVFFVLGWIFFLLHLSMYLHRLFRITGAAGSQAIKHVLLVIVIIGLLISFNSHDLRTANFFVAFKGFAKGIPQAYDAEWKRRYALINKAAAGDTVAVPALITTQGNILYFADIISNPASGANRSVARYWHKAGIYVVPDTSSARP